MIVITIVSMQITIQAFQFVSLVEESLRGIRSMFRVMTSSSVQTLAVNIGAEGLIVALEVRDSGQITSSETCDGFVPTSYPHFRQSFPAALQARL
jgi:hypothetical protein